MRSGGWESEREAREREGRKAQHFHFHSPLPLLPLYSLASCAPQDLARPLRPSIYSLFLSLSLSLISSTNTLTSDTNLFWPVWRRAPQRPERRGRAATTGDLGDAGRMGKGATFIALAARDEPRPSCPSWGSGTFASVFCLLSQPKGEEGGGLGCDRHTQSGSVSVAKPPRRHDAPHTQTATSAAHTLGSRPNFAPTPNTAALTLHPSPTHYSLHYRHPFLNTVNHPNPYQRGKCTESQ